MRALLIEVQQRVDQEWWQFRTLENLPVLGTRHGDVPQWFARELAGEGRELVLGYRRRARHVENASAVEIGRQRRCVGAGAILASHVVHGALADGGRELPKLQRGAERAEQELGVEMMAQDRPLEWARGERLLGPEVVANQRAARRRVRRGRGRVDHVLYLGIDR